MLDLLPSPPEVLELAPRVVSIMDIGGRDAGRPVDVRDVALCLDDGMVVGLDDSRLAQVAEGSVTSSDDLARLLGLPVDAERAARLVARCCALVTEARDRSPDTEIHESVSTPASSEIRSPPSLEDLEAEMERAMALMDSRAGRRLA